MGGGVTRRPTGPHGPCAPRRFHPPGNTRQGSGLDVLADEQQANEGPPKDQLDQDAGSMQAGSSPRSIAPSTIRRARFDAPCQKKLRGLELLRGHLSSITFGTDAWKILVRYLFERGGYAPHLLDDDSVATSFVLSYLEHGEPTLHEFGRCARARRRAG